MNLALYEISLDGHHGTYLSAIARAAVLRGWQVAVFAPSENSAHPVLSELRSLLPAHRLVLYGDRITLPQKLTSFHLLRYHFAQHRMARTVLSQCQHWADFIYTSNFDHMDKAIQLLGAPSPQVPMGGMCMRARFHLPAMQVVPGRSPLRSTIERAAFKRLLSRPRIRCVTTADPTLVRYMHQEANSFESRVRYVPEIGMAKPRIDPSEARRQLGLADDRNVVLVYGALTRRKAIPELLAAVTQLDQNLKPHVLIAGKADAETSSFIKTVNCPVTFLSGYASQPAEELCFSAADLVWVAYRDHTTMSGVFYQAVCAGKPVLAPNHGLLGWLTRTHQVGECVDLEDPRSIVSAISTLMTRPALRALYSNNTGRLAPQHYPGHFGVAVCSAIADSLNRIAERSLPVFQASDP